MLETIRNALTRVALHILSTVLLVLYPFIAIQAGEFAALKDNHSVCCGCENSCDCCQKNDHCDQDSETKSDENKECETEVCQCVSGSSGAGSALMNTTSHIDISLRTESLSDLTDNLHYQEVNKYLYRPPR